MNIITPKGPLGQKERKQPPPLEKPAKPPGWSLQRTPFKAKPKKAAKGTKDPGHLAKVRALPCCICEAYGMRQESRTTAHHVFHGRFSNHKTPDKMAIPLCDGHHQGDRDTSKLAIHRAKERWAAEYGPDYSYTAPTLDAIERMNE